MTTIKTCFSLMTSFLAACVLFLAAGFMFSTNSAHAVPVVVGGIAFDSSAFADVVLSDSGTISAGDFVGAPTLEAAITGSDLDSYFDPDADDWVQLGFVDNSIVNGPGDDLAIFEMLSTPDTTTLRLMIAGAAVLVPTADTGLTNTSGSQINVGFLDLDDFGLAANATVDNLYVFGIDLPEVAALGALNNLPVPEPTTVCLAAFGLLGMGYFRRRRA